MSAPEVTSKSWTEVSEPVASSFASSEIRTQQTTEEWYAVCCSSTCNPPADCVCAPLASPSPAAGGAGDGADAVEDVALGAGAGAASAPAVAAGRGGRTPAAAAAAVAAIAVADTDAAPATACQTSFST